MQALESQEYAKNIMDRFQLARMLKSSPPVGKEQFIEQCCRGKSVLDLGCIRHSAEFAATDPNWLHRRIHRVAARVVGVDYLPAEVEKLRNSEFHIICADVTRPLPLQEQFDVIVAGDLIEHLDNFQGFFGNCTRLLKPGGSLIITTPNPFFAGQFHFVALKRYFLINPEHTCWIDPQALSQLAARFGFAIAEAHYLRRSWQLPHLISESESNQYDILTGRWTNRSFHAKVLRRLVPVFFWLVYWPYKMLSGASTRLVAYSDYLAVLKK